MQIAKEKFIAAGKNLALPEEKLELLWKALCKEQEKNGFAKYLYYSGAALIIAAMTWFLSWGWELFGGMGLFLIAMGYALFFMASGSYLWSKERMRTLAGILITLAVCMTPLAIYGLQKHLQWMENRWAWMEAGTIFTGCLAIRLFPFPFLMAPITVSAWFLSMDITGNGSSINQRGWISLLFGIALTTTGVILDGKGKRGFAFWSHFFGASAFSVGLGTLFWQSSEAFLVLYAVINCLLICFSALIRRVIYMVLGALGFFFYLEHLADKFFEDSMLFPFALSAIGLFIIYLGLLYQKHASSIEQKLRSFLPQPLQSYLDRLHRNSF